jgi:EpsI family protein
LISHRHLVSTALILLAAAVAYAHWSALVGMKDMWDNTPMYSFGYIVPLVSAYLVWTRRDRLAAIEPRTSWLLGTPTLALALILLVGGHLGGVQIAAQAAFVVALVGVVLLVWGLEALRAVWMALAYLVLMLPFWDALTEPLHQPFQLLSANLGVRMLHAVGVPAFREGVLLYLPNITLEVARACSGVNYLVAILALGIPLAYLYLPTNGRRLLLVTTAVVVAALSNSLRVAMIGVLAHFEIGSPLHGPFHVLHGLFVSGIGYAVLFAGLRVLTPKAPAGQGPAVTRPTRELTVTQRRQTAGRAAVLAAVYLFVGFVLMRAQATPVSLDRALDALPIQLGDWRAQADAELDSRVWWDKADDEVRRRYRSPDGYAVDVMVGYFSSQRQGKELASYRLGALHRASTARAGWVTALGSSPVNVVRLSERGGERLGVLWYDVGGTVVDRPHEVQLRSAWNLVSRSRNDGTVVLLLSAASNPPLPEERQLAYIQTLAGQVASALARFKPAETARQAP